MACPGCGRPNSIRRRSCLYCGADLSSIQAELSLGFGSLLARDTGYLDRSLAFGNDFQVVCGPFMDGGASGPALPGEKSTTKGGLEAVVAAISAVSELDPFTVRQRVMKRSPVVVGQELDRESARIMVSGLTKQGLPASAISRFEVVSQPQKILCSGLEISAKGLELTDDQGISHHLMADDVLLLLIGRTEIQIKYETERQDFGGPSMNYQQSMSRRVGGRQRGRRTDVFFLLDIYLRSSTQSYRLLSSRTDLRPFGDLLRENREVLFDRMVTEVRRELDEEFFDSSFSAAVEGGGRGESDLTRYLGTTSFLRRHGVHGEQISHNLLQFEQYSRRFYLHLRRLIESSGRPDASSVASPKPAPGPKMVVMVRDSTLGNCPYCLQELLSGDGQVAACLSCNTLHHVPCWMEARGCTIFGCDSKRGEEVTADRLDSMLLALAVRADLVAAERQESAAPLAKALPASCFDRQKAARGLSRPPRTVSTGGEARPWLEL